MSICNALTNGLTKSCESNAGGVNKLWICDYENVVSTTFATSSSYPNDNWINTIGMTASTKFYEIQTRRL